MITNAGLGRRIVSAAAVTLLAAGLAAATTPVSATPARATHAAGRSAAPVPRPLPLRYNVGDSRQVITVTGHAGSTEARLQRWTKSGNGWLPAGNSVHAWVGENGITSHPREGYAGTPAGAFTLRRTFGRMPNPGTRLGYTKTDTRDWWNGDSNSPTYNTHQRCVASQCPFDTAESENLYNAGVVYDYAVVIDYNVAPAIPGRGSAFFWHVSNNRPTGGCVSIDRTALAMMMRWLQSTMHPRMVIGNI